MAKFPILYPSISTIIRFHHLPWEDGEGAWDNGKPVPLASHIVHLADRLSILVPATLDPLSMVQEKIALLKQHVPRLFAPAIFAALEALREQEWVWFDFVSPMLQEILTETFVSMKMYLNLEDFLSLCKLVAHLIDFRSPFTATHSSGVAAVAEAIGGFQGLKQSERLTLFVAGLLHDLGKVAIPNEILEKPSALDRREQNIMKQHPYFTYRVLSKVRGFRYLAEIASDHHERLDGRGYPRKKRADELCFASRIVATSDVFTALSESRPYRPALPLSSVLRILEDMGEGGTLDREVVGTIITHTEELFEIFRLSQAQATENYRTFREEVVNEFTSLGSREKKKI